MSQPRSFLMMGEKNYPSQNIETTFTKVFVGGLAWETQRDTMRRYFEQFGEILEAVVITEKNTGRSKGYGFVTFKDPEAAMRACQNPSPVIDGRRANCNLAYLGASKSTRSSTPQHGGGQFRPATGPVAPPSYYQHSSSLVHQSSGQYIFPHSAYGDRYSGDSQDTLFPLNYHSSVSGGHQQFSPYYTGSGLMPNFYPFYTQYSQSSHTHGFRIQYPQIIQFPTYMPHHYHSAGILSLPSSMAMAAATTPAPIATTATVEAGVVLTAGATSSQPSATVTEENPPT